MDGVHTRRTRAAPSIVFAVVLAAAAFVPGRAAAQTGTVRGVVTESGTQRPLSAVQVFVKGTNKGRVTNVNGQYVITEVPVGEVTLRVESIGYRSIEETVTVAAGQTVVSNFELSTSAVGLDEIVVTGSPQATAKRALGNSVGTVNAAAITEATPVTNVQQLLQGRSAGLTMMSTTGVVGGTVRTRIRGSSSITAGNEPVVYVDGVRVLSGTVRTEGNTAQGISLLEAYNPNDIESIELIKGPAAATLYGAEAATGVIQIITKKGRPSEGLQWTGNFEYGEVDWAVDGITTYWMCTDARIDAPSSNPGCSVFNKSQPLSERILVDHPLDPGARSLAVQKQYADKGYTEDYPCLYPQQQPCEPRPLRTGDTQNLNLSVRGGGDAYNFYISGEKSDENGTFFNNYNNRKGGRANFAFTPSTKANFGVNVGYAIVQQQIPQSDNSSNSILRNSYRGQAGGPNSQYLPGFRNFMPEFSNKYSRFVDQERLTMGVTGTYSPASFFTNKLTVGMDRNDRENNQFFQIDQTTLAPFGTNQATGQIGISYNKSFLWTIDYAGTLNAHLNDDISSDFSAGMQLAKRRDDSHSITGVGLVSNTLNLVSSAATRSATQGFSEQTSLGFYLNELVGFKDRLFATAAVRVDDNSAFGRDFSLVVYPKASLAYVISDEDFFNVPYIDDLKLRAAWGQAGNAPSPFSADRTYGTSRAVVGDAAVNTLVTNDFGNPNLKAETGDEIELGFESSLLKGRIGADFTFYHKTTKDALLSISDPPSSGWTGSHLTNVGEIKNVGFELSLDAAPIQRPNLSWDIIATFASNKNELVSFGTDAQGNPTLLESRFGDFLSVQRHREGYPLGGYWATDVKRDASGLPILDAGGAATVVDCTWDPANNAVCDEQYIGSPFPTRQVGLTNSFRIFKNLQIYSFLDYQGGHYQWCAICSVRTRIDLNSEAINDPRLDPSAADWNTYGKYERARLTSLQTTEFIYKADFMKLRELSATFTIPNSLTSRAGFSKAALTLSGRNLAIWTKYKGNADPEVNFTSDASFTTSDYGSIPMQRQWRLSMAVNF